MVDKSVRHSITSLYKTVHFKKNLIGGGKWGRRGMEVGGKGEGTGNGVPPCLPPHLCVACYLGDQAG